MIARPPGIGVGAGLCAAALALAGTAVGTAGQGFRGEARFGGGFLQARPLVRDSLPESDVPGEGFRRRVADGSIATCTQGGFCRWYRAGDVESLFVTTQDLLLTAWGGIEGLSAHVHLRGRYGSDDFWPLASQEFEAVAAYANYERGDYRVRAGRLYRTDGLGYYNFDGASFLWRRWDPLWAEVYGGWSLARGLNVPRSGDLVSRADVLAPDDRGFIVGAEIGGRLGRIASARLTYQREIRTDRLAIYSERVALDARAFLGDVLLDLSGEYDWAYAQLNELRLRANAPLPHGMEVVAEVRHRSPFFELWTIWGAFSPVGFNEGRLAVAWQDPELGLRFQLGGAYRDFEEANAGPTRSIIRDDGWRGSLDGSWSRDGWFASGGYRAEAGFGAARFGGDLRAGRDFGEGTFVSLRGSVTQTFGEFRLNEQIVSGVGVDGGFRLGDLTLSGGGGLYRIGSEERPGDDDWMQARAYTSISYRFGTTVRASRPGGEGGRP